MQNIYIDTHMKCDKETISSAKCVQNPLDEQTKPNQTTKLNYTKPQNETTKTEKNPLSRTESRSFWKVGLMQASNGEKVTNQSKDRL